MAKGYPLHVMVSQLYGISLYLLSKIGNGNVTIQGFIKQYFPLLLKTDDGIKTIQGFFCTWVLVTLPYITSYLHS
jgi:hypothetical protein